MADTVRPCHNAKRRPHWLAPDGASKGKQQRSGGRYSGSRSPAAVSSRSRSQRCVADNPSVEHVYTRLLRGREHMHVADRGASPRGPTTWRNTATARQWKQTDAADADCCVSVGLCVVSACLSVCVCVSVCASRCVRVSVGVSMCQCV